MNKKELGEAIRRERAVKVGNRVDLARLLTKGKRQVESMTTKLMNYETGNIKNADVFFLMRVGAVLDTNFLTPFYEEMEGKIYKESTGID